MECYFCDVNESFETMYDCPSCVDCKERHTRSWFSPSFYTFTGEEKAEATKAVIGLRIQRQLAELGGVCFYCEENAGVQIKYGQPICKTCIDSQKDISTTADLHNLNDEARAKILLFGLKALRDYRKKVDNEGKKVKMKYSVFL